MFRVASVSKIVVGQALAYWLKQTGHGWETSAESLLGWSFGGRKVTVGAIAAHHSGLTDDAGYLLAPEQSLRDFCQNNEIWRNQNTAYFEYSNLGYIILAAIIEKLSGRDFANAVAGLVPEGGGFNWAGVAADRMANALPTYRRDHDRFVPQIDAPPVPAAPYGNVGRFSPQGGLRLSLAGMLSLAESLSSADTTILWRQSDGPGTYLDGVFQHYGAGLQIFDAPAFYPRPLIGHFGNAYGFNGGVWYDAATRTAFAYALNGLETGDEDDSFSTEERAIFSLIAELEG